MGYSIQFIEIEENEKDKLADFKKKNPNLIVNGYPTIFKKVGGGELQYYHGDRSVPELTKWSLEDSIKKSVRNHSFRNSFFMGGKKTIRRKSANSKTMKRKR
jgi:hypothetical protein